MTEEPDHEPNARHPRESATFVGHDRAERELADALAGGRLHHAWLIAGPKGVGKATLAYRFARRVLGAARAGDRPLDVAGDDSVFRRIAANAHPDLRVLRRTLSDRGDRYRTEITADDARAVGEFLALKAGGGGWRVAIVDCVDDLNRHAANALLKTLEEPPPRAMLLLICHAPGAALATIRSRCRRLALRPLSDDDVRAAARAAGAEPPDDAVLRLAGGRPGRAIALQGLQAGPFAGAVEEALERAPQAGPGAMLSIAFTRGGATSGQKLDLLMETGQNWLRRRAGAADGGARFAAAWSDLQDLRDQYEGLGLDPNHALVRAAQILYRAAAT